MKPAKRSALSLSRFFAIAAAISALSLPALAYEEDTHFQMTYVICRSVGFTHDEALIVAAVDQGMDDSPGVVANGNLGPFKGVWPNEDEEWMWHALDKRGRMNAAGVLTIRDQLFQAALDETTPRNKLIRLGVFFHFQQDTWAHRHHDNANHLSRDKYITYNTPVGHAFYFNQPDRPPLDPVAALMCLEDGVIYARWFLKNGLQRNPSGFLLDYVPVESREDAAWSNRKRYFNQISLSGAIPGSAHEYLLKLIRAQIDQYDKSRDGSPHYFGYDTADQVNLNKVRFALKEVCDSYPAYQGINTITIPTTEEKTRQGFTGLSTSLLTASYLGTLSLGKQIISSNYNEGRLEIAYIGMDSSIYFNFQKEDKSWNGEVDLKSKAKEMCSSINRDHRMEIFYIGTDDVIYHNLQNTNGSGPWFGQTSLGGPGNLGKHIACAKNNDGSLEIFYIGTDNNIYHNWQENISRGGWHGEEKLPGQAQQITVAANKDGRLEIFYVGLNNLIFHNFQTTGRWIGEYPLGDKAKQISAIPDQEGFLNIFYVGMDNSIRHNRQLPAGDWTGMEVLPGQAKQVTAALNKDGRLEVFYIGMGNEIYHNFQMPDKTWYGEDSLGGEANQIITLNDQNGLLEIFYVGTDNGLYHNRQDGSKAGWNGELPVYKPL
ncbi:MAG TPA: hypothetical protein VGO50_14960 [Pyrinomonadaceae bacterium]|jgi:hypothetical protein|nr:hypothetical protein [Pyrinomonadaceae bacterium]